MVSDVTDIFDVFIIGGGINGVGAARDAVGRGYSVCLCEANDLGSGTSSASSKLIHGGLRYLEHYEFGLVRKALEEREVLMTIAPHIISPMRFILPHSKALRSWWLLRAGLFLYDHLARRKHLAGTQSVNLNNDPSGNPLKPKFKRGFEYSDCWVDDARLVVLNAMDAAQKGAQISVRNKVIKAQRHDGVWAITSNDITTGKNTTNYAKVLVNASGPWVDEVLDLALSYGQKQNVRQVRGSHIVVKTLFNHGKSYIFQNSDGRIMFAIPYENDFTLIGTTDIDHGNNLNKIKISDKEADYICQYASEYFEKPITTDDIVWSYSGVRPLYDDGASEAQEATRDYVIETETVEQSLLINIFGGKITTYRKLSEGIVEKVEAFLGKRKNAWTHQSTLPGGDLGYKNIHHFTHAMQAEFPFLDQKYIERLARLYGTNIRIILYKVTSIEDLGQDFGSGLYQREVEYLIAHEWAITTEDILFRRTKIGLIMPERNVAKLEKFLRLNHVKLVKSKNKGKQRKKASRTKSGVI